jgi:hypothetical protein
MASAHERLGREDAALGQLSAYLAQNPRSAPASLALGHRLARRGDERRAGLLLAHARELEGDAAPNDGRVAATLARLSAAAGGG